MKMMRSPRLLPMAVALAAAAAGIGTAQASSHREAPFITTRPKVDGTDFYMFRSYEPSRLAGEKFVTLIANFLPLQDPYGGPNYFQLDRNALYEIHIDNDGDAREDISFQFRFKNNLKGIELPIGGKSVAIPLIQAGQVADPNAATLNVNEQYTVDVVRGDRRGGQRASITNAAGGSATFDKPVDNIGTKTIPDYAAYAAKHVYNVNIPGCQMQGRLFVGQRKEAFAVNLGPIFDLVNAPLGVITDPSLINAAAANSIQDKNVTTMALEIPAACLQKDSNSPVIGGWMTASLRQGTLLDPTPRRGHQTTERVGGAWTQVSRLGMPLVNEVVIGLPDKDRFNSSKPKDDLQFADYVTNPTLPKLISIAFAADLGGADVVADELSAHRPRHRVPDRHQGRQPAQDGDAVGDAAAEHRHSAGAVRATEPARHRRQHPRRRQRQRRLPERPPAEGRHRRHLAGRGDGRAVLGQWQQRRARLRRGVQCVGGAARRHGVQAARRCRSGGGAAAADLPVPEYAERRRDVIGRP